MNGAKPQRAASDLHSGYNDDLFRGNEGFRKVVLNAGVWLAQAGVPAGGVESTVTAEDLDANLDPQAAAEA